MNEIVENEELNGIPDIRVFAVSPPVECEFFRILALTVGIEARLTIDISSR